MIKVIPLEQMIKESIKIKGLEGGGESSKIYKMTPELQLSTIKRSNDKDISFRRSAKSYTQHEEKSKIPYESHQIMNQPRNMNIGIQRSKYNKGETIEQIASYIKNEKEKFQTGNMSRKRNENAIHAEKEVTTMEDEANRRMILNSLNSTKSSETEEEQSEISKTKNLPPKNDETKEKTDIKEMSNKKDAKDKTENTNVKNKKKHEKFVKSKAMNKFDIKSTTAQEERDKEIEEFEVTRSNETLKIINGIPVVINHKWKTVKKSLPRQIRTDKEDSQHAKSGGNGRLAGIKTSYMRIATSTPNNATNATEREKGEKMDKLMKELEAREKELKEKVKELMKTKSRAYQSKEKKRKDRKTPAINRHDGNITGHIRRQ